MFFVEKIFLHRVPLGTPGQISVYIMLDFAAASRALSVAKPESGRANCVPMTERSEV